MAEPIDTPIQPTKNPIELAVPVAQRVEIRSVLLAECHASRSPDTDLGRNGIKIRCGVSEIGYGKEEEEARLPIRIAFEFSARNEDDDEPTLKIDAAFVLVYSVKTFDDLDNENLEAFALTNGVYNAWPYWREFVQNTIARMGVDRGITLPVFRVGQNPFEEQNSTVSTT